MPSARTLANERRKALIAARLAEKEAAEKAAAAELAAQRLVMVQWDRKVDETGAPMWNGRHGVIYAKPINKRMLLVTWDDGTTGKVWIRTEIRSRFAPGDSLWAVPDGKDFRLVGYYNGNGRRVG